MSFVLCCVLIFIYPLLLAPFQDSAINLRQLMLLARVKVSGREKSELIKFLVRLVCATASLNYITVVENSKIVSLIFYVNVSH